MPEIDVDPRHEDTCTKGTAVASRVGPVRVNPAVNRAGLWLALFRQLHDSGLPVAEARRRAGARLGFSTGS
jgi:hypothetical protein